IPDERARGTPRWRTALPGCASRPARGSACPCSSSAVTGGAVGQLAEAVLLGQLAPLGQGGAAGGPVHVVDLLFGPDVALRLAVALEAPLHQEGGVLVRQRHLVDRAVAGGAAEALVDVHAVVEVGEVGQAVDAVPGDGLAGAVALADRFEHGAADPDL